MTLLAGALIDLDGTIFLVFVIFFVLMFVLNQLLFKPMMKLADARSEAIDGAREDAKRMQKEAAEKGEKFEDELRKVRLEAGAERDRLRAEGQRLERQILDKVRDETQQSLADAEAVMSREAASVRDALSKAIPAMGQSAASRLIGREIN